MTRSTGLHRLDSVYRFRRGRWLGVAGESGYQLYIIMGGRAQLSAQSALGDITVRVAGPGESFPLAALIGSGTLITSVRAMTDMELLAIPCSRLRALCSENSEIGMHIYKEIADVLANRYKRTLRHLATGAEGVLPAADIWANV